jgi:hypothetical protein
MKNMMRFSFASSTETKARPTSESRLTKMTLASYKTKGLT